MTMAQFAETNTRNQPGRSFEASAEAPPKTAEAGTETEHTAETVMTTVKEYPMTTLAVAAGLAFAVGALWKAGRPRQTRLEALQARLPDLPSARQIRSYWR
jgi:hypothetical protein